MKVERTERKHNGMNFVDLTLKKKVAASVCIGEQRQVVIGYPQVTLASKAFKFGDEVIFGVFSPKTASVAYESRNSSKWDRVEINIPKEEAVVLLKAALKELMING